MELNEFQIADLRAGANRQSDAIGGRGLRIRGVAIELPHASRSQQDGGARNVVGQTFFVEHGNACDPSTSSNQVGRESERSK
jgi:hypothetical protein